VEGYTNRVTVYYQMIFTTVLPKFEIIQLRLIIQFRLSIDSSISMSIYSLLLYHLQLIILFQFSTVKHSQTAYMKRPCYYERVVDV